MLLQKTPRRGLCGGGTPNRLGGDSMYICDEEQDIQALFGSPLDGPWGPKCTTFHVSSVILCKSLPVQLRLLSSFTMVSNLSLVFCGRSVGDCGFQLTTAPNICTRIASSISSWGM
mmetsp:Transcript_75985/g.180760  ORF Transcript_75985/g.180760 Transcript_75985/m.180760 type:complete len:116 (+) Transcript_75985:129-476(+)